MSESNTIVEGQDLVALPESSHSLSGTESGELRDVDDGPHQVDSQPSNAEAEDGEVKAEILVVNEGDTRNPQNPLIMEAKVDNTLAGNSSDMEISDEENETLRVEKKLDDVSSGAHSISFTVEEKLDVSSVSAKKRCLDVQNGSPILNHTMDALSGVKRPRMTFDDQQPSIRIVYNFLTRASKQKLKELLQKWSEWQAEQGSLQENEPTESGEETYFPALQVGAEKPSSVSFCIDNKPKNTHDAEFVPLDSNIVPLYDRGFTMGLTSADASSNLEGGLEIKGEASRCFNCGSYSHSLKQCPKPRDSVAVNNARKQHQKFKRNQNAASRNAIRYYQSSQGGKYDDLKAGVLGAETRELLGLGEFDPPPWLNRMREIGYPPGYLAPEDESEPSGIIIYADEETDDGHEDGEIAEMVQPEPRMKMTVEFPGINAPIPAKADEKLWARDPSSSESFRSRSQPQYRLNHSSEPGSRVNHQMYHGDFEDEGPPGVDHRVGSSYPPRYGNYDSAYSFQSLELFRSRSQPHYRLNHSFEPGSRGHHQMYHGDFEDEGPPGVDHRVGSSYPPRYGIYDSAYSFQSLELFRSRSQPHYRLNHSSKPGSRGHHQMYHGDFEDEGPPGVDHRVGSSYPPRYGIYDSAYSFQSLELFRSRSQPHYRLNHSSEPGSRWHERMYNGDFEDEGPPGVDYRVSSSYPPRYGNYDSAYSFQSPRDHISRPRSPTLGMSYYERSPLVYEDFASYGSYSSRHSPWSHGSTRYENEIEFRWDNGYQEYSSWPGHRYHSHC